MAYGYSSNPGPDPGDQEMDSLYSEEGSEKEEKGESIDQEEQEQMEQTAMLPVKVLQGKSTEPIKEGDEVVLKVLKVHGTQAEVAYSETPPGEIGAGEEGGKGPKPKGRMMGRGYDQEMSEMMSEAG